MIQFEGFPKIARLNRDIVITEKIDGTNAQVFIRAFGDGETTDAPPVTTAAEHWLWAGSRNRWITSEKDNFGFASWVQQNAEGLVETLGPGRHFGEWWGPGIQRGYGLPSKRFSLFNVSQWSWLANAAARAARPEVPEALSVVPVLYEGPWFVDGRWAPEAAKDALREHGSAASPGFMRPEGIVVFHTASGNLFKSTLEKDEKPKGSNE
jgi:hypothetical protein